MDVLVLACTHFPLLAEEIATILPGVTLIDGAAGIARRVAYLTKGQLWPDHSGEGRAIFTGNPPQGAMCDTLGHFGLTRIESL